MRMMALGIALLIVFFCGYQTGKIQNKASAFEKQLERDDGKTRQK